MASTCTQIVAKFRRVFSDCPADRALELLNEFHQEFLTRCQLRSSTIYITLASGTREYTLDALASSIQEVYYETSATATDWTPLAPRSTDYYIDQRPGWRMSGIQSKPLEYYVQSAVDGSTSKAVIGFEPIPDTSTSGTYPRVAVYCTYKTDLIGSDTVPTLIVSDRVYYANMAKMWAEERHKAEFGEWEAIAERELNKNIVHIKGMQSHSSFQLIPTLRSRSVT